MAAVNHAGELLSAYLDGELIGDELDAVAQHLSNCLDCIAEFRELKEARAAIRLLPRLELPEDLAGELGIAFHLGELLSAFLDGELVGGETQLVRSHLAECARCRDQLRELDAARTAVRAMPTLEFQAVRAPTPLQSRPRRTWLKVASIAAAIGLVVGVSTTVTRSEPGTPIDLDSLTVRHAARTSVDNGVAIVPAGVVGEGE